MENIQPAKYRYSNKFWLKKTSALIGMFFTGWLIWLTLQWSAGSEPLFSLSDSSVNDPTVNTEQIINIDESNKKVVRKKDDTKYTVTTTHIGASEITRYKGQDCAFEFYASGNKNSSKKTKVIVSACKDQDLKRDFTWKHHNSEKGYFYLTSTPVNYCIIYNNRTCNSGDALLEVVSEGNDLVGPTRVAVIDSTGVNQNNAVDKLRPIMESVSISRVTK